MGAKKSKVVVIAPKSSDLTEHDYVYLMSQTGLSRMEIRDVFERYRTDQPEGKIDKKEFIRLYKQLRSESDDILNETADFTFRAFDNDNTGSITFNDFMIAYALTSRGDPRKKLEYAFALYDKDNNGYLDLFEVVTVMKGMLDIWGADNKSKNPEKVAHECFDMLDVSKDGKISKSEFIDGLLKNHNLRAIMTPFI